MKKLFCCMNRDSQEIEFYNVNLDEKDIMKKLNQRLMYNLKPVETNIHVEVNYQSTIIQDEDTFRSIILSIFGKQIINLAEIHHFCHSRSSLKNSYNIQIIHDILSEMDFCPELSLTDNVVSCYTRILMEQNHMEAAKLMAEQVKTAAINAAAMEDLNFAIKHKQKVY